MAKETARPTGTVYGQQLHDIMEQYSIQFGRFNQYNHRMLLSI